MPSDTQNHNDIIELRKRLNQIESALHHVIEALHYDNPDQRKAQANQAFERMPL
jgi:hypothetical protein